MRCATVCARLGAFLDGELDATSRQLVSEHLDQCDACARELSLLQCVVVETTRSLSTEPVPDGFEHAILKAIARQKRRKESGSENILNWLPRRLRV